MKKQKWPILALITVLAIASVLTLMSCRNKQEVETGTSVVYGDEMITVHDISAEPSPFVKVTHDWALLNAEAVFDEKYSVFAGEVIGFTDIDVEYVSSYGLEAHSYETILSVRVTSILHDNTGISTGDIVTVGIPYNNWTYDVCLPRIAKGMEVVAFCYHCEDMENDWIQHVKYVDYWVYAPLELFLQKVGSTYITTKDCFFDKELGEPLPSMMEPAGTEEDYEEWLEEIMLEFKGTKYEAILKVLSEKRDRVTSYMLEMCSVLDEEELISFIEDGFEGGAH